jgi:Tol biopolymer transport system component
MVLGFAIAACSAVAPTEAANISNTASTPNPTRTAKILPTSTETALSVIEETPTFQPEILAEVATLDAIVTDIPELENFYDRFCITHGNCAYVSDLGLSPNKKWAVFFTINDSAGLSVVNVDNKKQWNISYYDITGTYGGTVRIEHWSHDGHYLYVSPQTEASGGLFWFWRDYIQLIRINLDDGTWMDTNMGSAFSFSPDDRFIAYRHEQNVIIHELQTGQQRTFTVPSEYGAFGRFVWSPDGKQIIFIGSSVDELESDELSDQANGFTLFYWILET